MSVFTSELSRSEVRIATWAKDPEHQINTDSLIQSESNHSDEKEHKLSKLEQQPLNKLTKDKTLPEPKLSNPEQQLEPKLSDAEQLVESTKEQDALTSPLNNKISQKESSPPEGKLKHEKEDEGCSPPALAKGVAIPVLKEGEYIGIPDLKTEVEKIWIPGCQQEDIPSKILHIEAKTYATQEENKKLQTRVMAKDATIDLLQDKINELEKKKNNEIQQLKQKNQSLGDRLNNTLKASNNKNNNSPLCPTSSLNNEMNRVKQNNRFMENQLMSLRNQSRMDALRHAEYLLRTEPWRLHQRLETMNNYFQDVLHKERKKRTTEVSALNNQLQATKQALYASVEKAKKRGRQDQDQDQDYLNTSNAPRHKKIKLENVSGNWSNNPSYMKFKTASKTKLSRES